jgi:two-component system, cell cycle sensor histidine kinase and response regulator CckA
MSLSSTSPARPEAVTASIAHELSNVLTVVRTYTHFARQPTTPEQLARDLVVVAAAAERAGALVDWLASTSEEAPRAPDELSANEFVSGLCVRLQQLTPSGASVGIMRVGDDVQFRANALRLEHVVMSLVLAASQQAVDTAFEFSVKRSLRFTSELPPVVSGEYAVIGITCSNLSLSNPWKAETATAPDQIAALVAPFSDLLRTMHGQLEIRALGELLHFDIYLPAVPTTESPSVRPRLELVPPSAHTVCIIENETAIRLAMLRSLAGAGYLVLEANDGVAARRLLIERGQAVKLLVCDLGLITDSEDFFAWVKATCPQAAVLLVSGNAQGGEAKASSIRARFLSKPFSPTALVAAAKATIAEAEAHHLAGGRRLVVLIVDDEEVVRNSFVRLLAECNFETVLANTGSHALQIMSERNVDAIVADQFMPGLDGIGLLSLVRERFPTCTRILCTGQPASELVINAVNGGRIQRVLSKSMHAVALRDEIERAVLEAVYV